MYNNIMLHKRNIRKRTPRPPGSKSFARYQGEYIAIPDFGSGEILAHGKNPSRVYKDAVKQGCKEPVTFYVQAKNAVCLY